MLLLYAQRQLVHKLWLPTTIDDGDDDDDDDNDDMMMMMMMMMMVRVLQISSVRSPWRLKFARWLLIFVCPL